MSLASSVELGIDSKTVFIGPFHGPALIFGPELITIPSTLAPVFNQNKAISMIIPTLKQNAKQKPIQNGQLSLMTVFPVVSAAPDYLSRPR